LFLGLVFFSFFECLDTRFDVTHLTDYLLLNQFKTFSKAFEDSGVFIVDGTKPEFADDKAGEKRCNLSGMELSEEECDRAGLIDFGLTDHDVAT
jgi:hypothetical protein